MNLNIGITCYYGSNQHKFKRILASLFVEPNTKPYDFIVKEYIDMIKIITEHYSNDNNTNFELIIAIIKTWFELKYIDEKLKLIRVNNSVLVKKDDINLQLNLTDDLVKFMMIITDVKTHQNIANKNLYVFDNILCILLNQLICSNIVKKYVYLDNKFDTIQEYINDMLNNGFVQCEEIPSDKLEFTFIIDGYSGIKYESFDRFYHSLSKDLFNKICPNNYYLTYKLHPELTPKIKHYFETEFENNYNENDIQNIHQIIDEFKSLTKHKVNIIGTKYKNLVTMNRNIFMMNNNDKYVQFIDDDDFSSSMFQHYAQIWENLKRILEKDKTKRKIIIDKIYEIEKTKALVGIKRKQRINKFDPSILLKFNIIEFRKFIKDYCKFLIQFIYNNKKYNYESILSIHQDKLLNQLRIKFKELYLEYNHYETINHPSLCLHENESFARSAFWGFTIQPYTLNNFSVVDDVFNEDYVYRINHDNNGTTGTSVIFYQPFYYYLGSTNSNGILDNGKYINMLKWVYNAGLTQDNYKDYEKNCYDKYETRHYYDYTDQVEWFDGTKYVKKNIAELYWL